MTPTAPNRGWLEHPGGSCVQVFIRKTGEAMKEMSLKEELFADVEVAGHLEMMTIQEFVTRTGTVGQSVQLWFYPGQGLFYDRRDLPMLRTAHGNPTLPSLHQ